MRHGKNAMSHSLSCHIPSMAGGYGRLQHSAYGRLTDGGYGRLQHSAYGRLTDGGYGRPTDPAPIFPSLSCRGAWMHPPLKSYSLLPLPALPPFSCCPRAALPPPATFLLSTHPLSPSRLEAVKASHHARLKNTHTHAKLFHTPPRSP
jgi:hypothetical protein